MMQAIPFSTGFGLLESLFPTLFILVFAIIIGAIVISAVKGINQYAKNEASPVLSVNAKLVGKRTNVSHHHTGDNMSGHSTSYYVTFQVDSGDRIEFCVNGKEYGLLAEGDSGKLTFQGTRFLDFQRSISGLDRPTN